MPPGIFYIKGSNYFSSLSEVLHCTRVLATMLFIKLKENLNTVQSQEEEVQKIQPMKRDSRNWVCLA